MYFYAGGSFNNFVSKNYGEKFMFFNVLKIKDLVDLDEKKV